MMDECGWVSQAIWLRIHLLLTLGVRLYLSKASTRYINVVMVYHQPAKRETWPVAPRNQHQPECCRMTACPAPN